MDENIYKIAIAGLLHDIGKFAERANMVVGEEFLNNNADLYQPYFNSRHTHKHAVYTAAFIDHIEKLLPGEFNKRDWGMDDPFINLAAGHHKPETPLQWVIAIADRLSSGFEREEFENYNRGIGLRDYKKTRLITIFEGVDPAGRWERDSLESFHFRYPLLELSPENIFPVDSEEIRLLDSEKATKEYNNLFIDFIDSLERLIHKQNITLWFEHFDSLFMIYASHIPAATVGNIIPTVSLYDHCKTTAALASAIYRYHRENKNLEIRQITDHEDRKFLMVTGDFYGIQNFIFSQGGSTNKGSAKILRGRSLAVSLLSELAADMLCREIGLPTSSIILNAAGKFTLLAPNTERARIKIREVEEKINHWLIKNFYGEATMGISYVEASGHDFTSKRFSALWEALSKELEKKKYHKIDLERYGGAVADYLDQFNNTLSKKLCPFCGKRPSSQDVENDPLLGEEKSGCRICRDHIYLGTSLVKSERVAITTVEAEIYGDKMKAPLFDFYQISFDVAGKLSSLADKGVLLKYWDISVRADGKISRDVTSKFINGYIPAYSEEDETEDALNRLLHGEKSERAKDELFDMIKNGFPKTLHHIAKMALNKDETRKDQVKDRAGSPDTTQSGSAGSPDPEKGNSYAIKFKGIEALGVMKADVDNLGLIFTCGLKHNSLSHLATLSRQLNHYFTVYLPSVLSKYDEFKDSYTVFAGGDDLFLIGPWNRIIDLALFLHDSFRKYACENKQITLSAGISVHKPGEPIPYISETAEESLKKAKHNTRDSVTLFDQAVKWAEFAELSTVKSIIVGWLDASLINNAMLFRLNAFSNMARQEHELLRAVREPGGIDLEECEALKWKSMFKYSLVRNIGKHLKGGEKERAIAEVEQAVDWLVRYGGAMKIPVWQIIYNQR